MAYSTPELGSIGALGLKLKGTIQKFKENNFPLLNLYIKELKELSVLLSKESSKPARKQAKSLCLNTIETDMASVGAEFKAIHHDVSAIGTCMDSVMCKRISEVANPAIFEDDSIMLGLIYDELLINLEVDICQIFNKETKNTIGTTYDVEYLHSFEQVVQEFSTTDNYDSFILFFTENHNHFGKKKHRIVYELLKAKFYSLVLDHKYVEAVNCASSFSEFPEYGNETQKLTSILAFPNPDSRNRLLSGINGLILAKTELIAESIKAAFELKLYPMKSPLQLCFAAGCLASGILYKANLASVASHGKTVHCFEELSSSIPLPSTEFVFHTIFVCPIQQNEIKEKQSAVRLECGHVLSLHNLNEIKATTASGETR